MMKPKKPRVHPDSFATLDDNEENLLVTVELPGVKKEDIDLRMCNDVIYVKAEKEGVQYLGHIHSTEKIEPKKTEAPFRDELLDIKVPLKEKKSTAIRIEIN